MLLTPPENSGLSPEHLATAEALIAADLNLLDLAERAYVQQGSVGSAGTIALARPATAILSLSLNGLPAAGVRTSPTVLSVGGAVGMVSTWGAGPARASYAVEYRAGWTADTLPEPIRQAVLMTAAHVTAAADRVGVVSERMGPVSRTYADASAGSVPPDALGLLAAWRPLRL